MFKFLKDKLKKAVSSFSQKVDEEGEKEEVIGEQESEYVEEEKPEVEAPYEEPQESKPEEPVKEELPPEPQEEQPPEQPIEKKETTEILKDVEDTVEKQTEPVEEPTLAAVPDAPPAPEEIPKEEEKEPEDEVEEILHEAEAPPEKKETPTEPLLHTERKPDETPKPEPVKESVEEPKTEPEPKKEEPEKPKKSFFTSITKRFHKEKEVDEEPEHPQKEEPLAEKDIPEKKEVQEETPEEKKGLFSSIKKRITTTKINEKQFEDMFADLEMAMLENNVAMEVIEKIKEDLKSSIVDQPIRRTKVEQVVVDSLKDSIKGLFMDTFDITQKAKEKKEKPFVIAFVGINGSGKTTSIAKLTSLLRQQGLEVVIAAADTFRAASIEQLSLHGERLGVKVIKHDYGSDPAAVAFDAIKHAKSKEADVVLIDTAGRMHKNANLMDEMKKIVRVAKPDLKIFVGESITGNDCIEQAKSFNEAVEIDGIILSKADIDEKGGAAVSVSFITQKPVLYLGVGQDYQDLQPFDHAIVMENLGLT